MLIYGVNPVPRKYNSVPVHYLVEHKPESGNLNQRPFSFIVPMLEQAMQVAEAILSQEIEYIQNAQILSQTPTEDGGLYIRYRMGDYPRKHFSKNVENGVVTITPVDIKTSRATY